MARSTKSTKASSRAGKLRRLTGLAVAPGICVGTVYRIDSEQPDATEYRVTGRQVAAEQERLSLAVDRAREEIESLKAAAKSAQRDGGAELGYLLDAHHHMLDDSRLVRGASARIAKSRINAEAAVRAELTALAVMFEAIEDPYLSARRQDIADVASRLIRCLNEKPFADLSDLPQDAVVVVEELSPADTAMLDPDKVGGIATEAGGLQGHTAIMARALGLPAVLGVHGLMNEAVSGERIVVDGDAGEVVLRPNADIVRRVRSRQRKDVARRRRLSKLQARPATTTDGTRIGLQANIDLVQEVEDAARFATDGIGLLRTEFLYMNRAGLPDVDEQYEVLRDVAKAMDGGPVTVRTLDIGGDKLDPILNAEIGLTPGANPALGLRAIRLSQRRRQLLNTQLEAILRAAGHGPMRILLPMITVPSEVRMVRAALRRVAARLRDRKVAIPEDLPPVGAMIETPAAALTADRLSAISDFLSIGTNDLTMYTLAVDRADDQVADLYDPMHPAVLRLVQFVAAAGKSHDTPVNLCGEIAGDPRFTALLLGLGLRALSMSPHSLLAVKERIRAVDLDAAESLADNALKQADSDRIAALVDDFNGLL